jgi:hypothetical protein
MSVGKTTHSFGGPRVTALAAVTFAIAALASSVARFPPRTRLSEGDSAASACVGWGLSEGVWTRNSAACDSDVDAPEAGCAHDAVAATPSPASWSFDSNLRKRCGLRRETNASNAFSGKRVVVVGDSIARHVYASVLRVAAVDREAHRLRAEEKHRDWSVALGNEGVAEFVWAPFASEIADVLDERLFPDRDDTRDGVAFEQVPVDVLVLGAALWDLLRGGANAIEAYERDLETLQSRLRRWNVEGSSGAPVTFWLTGVVVDASKLVDPKKIDAMTRENLQALDRAARRALGFLPRQGSGDPSPPSPSVPVDVGALSSGCGAVGTADGGCTSDGIHYDDVVYDAAAQIIGNAVRLVERSNRASVLEERIGEE